MDRIEAAARKLCETRGQNYDDLPKLATYLQRKSAPEGTYADKQEARDDAAGVLAAADAVSVSDDDAALLDKFSTYAAGWKETLTARGEEVPSDVSEIWRLVELARRGAVVSVVPAGYLLVEQSAIAWLMGEGPDKNGREFGDDKPDVHWAYWWRRPFAAMLAAAPPSPMLTEAEVRADERRKLEQAMRDKVAECFAKAEAVREGPDGEDPTGYGPSTQVVDLALTARNYEFAADAITKEGKP